MLLWKWNIVLFYTSVIPVLSGDSCYFNCGFTLSPLIMPNVVPAWKEHKDQVLYRGATVFGTSSSCLHDFASYLKSIFSVIINLN